MKQTYNKKTPLMDSNSLESIRPIGAGDRSQKDTVVTQNGKMNPTTKQNLQIQQEFDSEVTPGSIPINVNLLSSRGGDDSTNYTPIHIPSSSTGLNVFSNKLTKKNCTKSDDATHVQQKTTFFDDSSIVASFSNDDISMDKQHFNSGKNLTYNHHQGTVMDDITSQDVQQEQQQQQHRTSYDNDIALHKLSYQGDLQLECKTLPGGIGPIVRHHQPIELDEIHLTKDQGLTKNSIQDSKQKNDKTQKYEKVATIQEIVEDYDTITPLLVQKNTNKDIAGATALSMGGDHQSIKSSFRFGTTAVSSKAGSHKEKQVDDTSNNVYAQKILSMYGYKDTTRRYIQHLCMCVIFNIFYILFHKWFPQYWPCVRYEKVKKQDDAQYIHIYNSNNTWTLVPVTEQRYNNIQYLQSVLDENVKFSRSNDNLQDDLYGNNVRIYEDNTKDYVILKMFIFKYIRYYYNQISETYTRVKHPVMFPLQKIQDGINGIGLTEQEYLDAKLLFGPNSVNIHTVSIFHLICEQIVHPLNVFQAYSIILWYNEDYEIFASLILVMAVISVSITVHQTYLNMQRLLEMTSIVNEVTVIRDGKRLCVLDSDLVPGDIFEVSECKEIPCDALLLTGTVLVNESMLTGESVPVVKVPVLDTTNEIESSTTEILDTEVPIKNDKNEMIVVGKNARSTQYSGSRVIQVRRTQLSSDKLVLAMAVRTGFATARGSMICSMLFPPKSSFKFERQSYQFLLTQFALAIVGFGIAVWKYSDLGAPLSMICIRAQDLITVVVPPTLPLAMSIGMNYSLQNQRKLDIYCLIPACINYAGKIKLMCFDKTGTQTESSLKQNGICVQDGDTRDDYIEAQATSHYTTNKLVKIPSLIHPNKLLPQSIRSCMVVCHSLVDHCGTQVGDPQEVEAFTLAKGVQREVNNVPGILSSVEVTHRNINNCVEKERAEDIQAQESDNNTVDLNKNSSIQLNLQNMLPWRIHTKKGIRCDDDDTTVNLSKGNECIQQLPQLSSLECVNNDIKYAKNQLQTSVPSTTATVAATATVQESISTEIKYYILKQFQFEPHFQRMSVLSINTNNGALHLYMKGSPEMVQKQADESSIPSDYSMIVDYYTSKGYRVLALAERIINQETLQAQEYEYDDEEISSTGEDNSNDSSSGYYTDDDVASEYERNAQRRKNNKAAKNILNTGRITKNQLYSKIRQVNDILSKRNFNELREDLELNVKILGQIVFENLLKSATRPTIVAQQGASTRATIITGDNVRTAVSVGKESNIIQPDTGVFISSLEYGRNTKVQLPEVQSRTLDKQIVNDVFNNQQTADDDTVITMNNSTGATNTNKDTIYTNARNCKQSNVGIRWVLDTDERITQDPYSFKLCQPNDIDSTTLPFTRYELAQTGDCYAALLEDHKRRILSYEQHRSRGGNQSNYVGGGTCLSILDVNGMYRAMESSSTYGQLLDDRTTATGSNDMITGIQISNENRILQMNKIKLSNDNSIVQNVDPSTISNVNDKDICKNTVIEDDKQVQKYQPLNNDESLNDSTVNSKRYQLESCKYNDGQQAEKLNRPTNTSATARLDDKGNSKEMDKVKEEFEWPYIESQNMVTPQQQIITNCVVFARMTPEQKMSLITNFQKLGFYTGMCGDGANDCGAQKAAHIGVSLVETEASLAAPFTSQIPNISCVSEILREGRSALTTCFQLFRFMSMYSFLQFFSCICQYFMGGNYCDQQFQYQDVFVVFLSGLLMGRMRAGGKQTKKRPSGNLLSQHSLCTLIIHMIVSGQFQCCIYNLIRMYPGYEIYPNDDWACSSWEATTQHYFTCQQYILYCILFSIARPWKEYIWQNRILSVFQIGISTITLSMYVFGPSDKAWQYLVNADIYTPIALRLYVLLAFAVHCVMSICIEYVVQPSIKRVWSIIKHRRYTDTVFGKGEYKVSSKVKIYHMIRRAFEDNFLQNVRVLIQK